MPRKNVVIPLLLLYLLPPPARLAADEKEDQARLIRSIVATWKARKDRVKTIRFEAIVETFYPKDSLSEKLRVEFKDSSQVIPEVDRRFSGEPCSWAIEFAGPQIRKEYKLTNEFLHDKTYELGLEHSLHLFSKGRYRYFRPTKDGLPKGFTESTSVIPDANLHEGASHIFLLSVADLPLLWLAGGVNGHWPTPGHLQLLDAADRFRYAGEAAWKGQKCVVLVVPEQQSDTSVREFWVAAQEPYLIHRCRARDGDTVYWELKVDHRREGDFVVPAEWTATGYNIPGNLFYARIFSMKRAEVNVPLPPELFDKKLEPGSTVFHTEANTLFEVNASGELGPLGSGSRRSSWLWIVLSIVSLLAIALLWRIIHGRSRIPKSTKG